MAQVEIEEKTKKVFNATPKQTARKWYLVDARDKVLGRLATRLAPVLMGKTKPSWQPHLDNGDFVVVINAQKVKVTGTNAESKKYYRYSGYPGGLREETLKSMRIKHPEEVVLHSVRGMLPKTRLGKAMIKKLYVYAGEKHPHEAQKPEEIEL
jgi:large subunit ribosomal protein L13